MMAKADHDRRDDCARDFDKIYAIAGRRVSTTTFWSVNGLLVLVFGAVLGAVFTLQITANTNIADLKTQGAVRSVVLETVAKSLVDLRLEGSSPLQQMIGRLESIELRMKSIEDEMLRSRNGSVSMYPTSRPGSGT